MSLSYDPGCVRCGRLAGFLAEVRQRHPDYHARPVEPFGDRAARLLIVGLAPGLHGANATGRPFTGDYAGILLYQALYRHGFSDRPQSVSRDDGLQLRDCRITNAVKCLPPQNKPATAEVRACNPYLAAELAGLPEHAVVLALGTIAHQAVLRALVLKAAAYPFGHGHILRPRPGLSLVDSYHCSRYNTQTGRLTPEMFHAVLEQVRELLAHLPD